MNGRMQVLLTVVGLALAALLILAGSAVADNLDSPPNFHVEDAAALQSGSHWSSGWVDIAADTATTFTHDLGGDPDDYAVELWFRDTDPGGKGINNWGFGGLEAGSSFYGAYWQKLTDTTIEVVRHREDVFADQVRVRVWFPDPPAWDSGWVPIAPITYETLTHNLGGNVDDYVVGLWFRDTAADGIGINARCYGGLQDMYVQMHGAYWDRLTDTTIRVWRYYEDGWADEVRVRIFVPDPPDWDSGWVSFNPGTAETFTHSLGGNPNLYLIRGWQKASFYGINHQHVGGFEDRYYGFRGTNWENLTDTTVNVLRHPDDFMADQVRFRIWVRDFRVYLPLVLKGS
jgi:hypothetical protein